MSVNDAMIFNKDSVHSYAVGVSWGGMHALFYCVIVSCICTESCHHTPHQPCGRPVSITVVLSMCAISPRDVARRRSHWWRGKRAQYA